MTKLESLEKLNEENKQELQKARGEFDQAFAHAAHDLEREQAAREQPSLENLSRKSSVIHSGTNRQVTVNLVASTRVLGKGSFGEVDVVQELSTGVCS